LYAALVALVNPEPGRIFVYGAEHQERRLTGVYARRAGGFKYSGTEKRASGEWPPVLEELHAIASRIAGEFARSTGVELGLKCEPVGFRAQRPVDLVTDEDALAPAAAAAPAPIASAASAASPASSTAAPFWDTVLINHYRDGNDCISWHSDKDGAGATIASFSLGATREFHIRRRPARGQAKSTSSKSLELHKLQLADGSLLLMLPGMQDRWHHSLPPRKGMPHGRINVTFRAHGRQQNEGPQTVLS
jgi:alkylated DNA repair dioxygenase AlkB